MMRSFLILVTFIFSLHGAMAQQRQLPQGNEGYSSDELVGKGHTFFGKLARGFGEAVESAVSKYGQPNGYILGQEGSGALVVGLRYGEGNFFTKKTRQSKIFWQGPSIGFDAGADGDRVMMLVYKLRTKEEFYERFGGVDGSAYLIGGFSVSALARDGMVVVPIRAGVGIRLGINVGYLKFSETPTWNPF
jgi:hypothetical protein